MPKTSKPTSSDLRIKLFETMNAVSSGKMQVNIAQQVTKAASQITCSLRTDIERDRLALKLSRSVSKPMSL